jgi:hypothetical protein
LLVSLAAPRLPVVPGYDLWLDPNAMVVLTTGVQGPSEHFPFTLTVPNDPALAFVACTQQAASGTLAGGLWWSNPVAYAHQ